MEPWGMSGPQFLVLYDVVTAVASLAIRDQVHVAGSSGGCGG